MHKSKFSGSQIVGILKEAEAGIPVADLLRRHAVSKATLQVAQQLRRCVGAGHEAVA